MAPGLNRQMDIIPHHKTRKLASPRHTREDRIRLWAGVLTPRRKIDRRWPPRGPVDLFKVKLTYQRTPFNRSF